MWREDAARFGKDILLRPPSPPRISEGSSSEENIICCIFSLWKGMMAIIHLKKSHPTLEREGLESSILESATYTASPTWEEIF